MLSLLFSAAAGGVVCDGILSLLIVPRELCDRRLRAEMVVFLTDPPPGVQGGVISLPPGLFLRRIGIFMRSGCPACAGIASYVHEGRRSWSCTHLSGGNSNKRGGRQMFVAPVILL